MDRVLTFASALCFGVVSFISISSAADAGHGKDLFSAKCTLCHNADKDGPNKLGPNLYGVIGRPSGSLANFSYSTAMQNAHLIWAPANLQTYLQGPQKMLPGVRMTFPGFSNPSDAADVTAYLSTLK